MDGARLMTFENLISRTSSWRGVNRLEAYFNGDHRLEALGVTLPPEMRVLEMVVTWPRTTVETLAERLTIEGFQIAEDASTDKRCWDWWQANDLDANASLLHTEAFVQGRGFVIVGPGDDPSVPRITVHRCIGIAVRRDPTTGRVVEAVRRYKDADGRTCAAYYVPGRTSYVVRNGGTWVGNPDATTAGATIMTGIDMVPVVPFVNRARIGDRMGRSEMLDVITLTDACSRTLTNLQVAQETLSMPQRVLLGAKPDDFKDAQGNVKTSLDVYLGHLLTGPSGASATQFPGAQLDQVINVVKLYAQMVSAATGVPPSFLGISTDNPASADAIRASESRLVKRAETKQTAFGEAWEQVMRLCIAMVDGELPPATRRLETVWRDASTPTLQSKAQAVSQLVASGIIPASVGRRMIGLSPELLAMADAADGDVGQLMRSVGITPQVTAAGATS